MSAEDAKPAPSGETLGWIAAVAGMAGASLLASNTWISGFGWFAYIVSSVAWCAIALRSGSRPLLAMNAVYTLINVVGIVRWMG